MTWHGHRGREEPGNLKQELLTKIYTVADRAIAAWLDTPRMPPPLVPKAPPPGFAPAPPGPPTRPKSPALAWPRARHYDISDLAEPAQSASSSDWSQQRPTAEWDPLPPPSNPPSNPSTWSASQPQTPGLRYSGSPGTGPSQAASWSDDSGQPRADGGTPYVPPPPY